MAGFYPLNRDGNIMEVTGSAWGYNFMWTTEGERYRYSFIQWRQLDLFQESPLFWGYRHKKKERETNDRQSKNRKTYLETEIHIELGGQLEIYIYIERYIHVCVSL